MRRVCIGLIALAAPARADVPEMPPSYAQLFDQAHSWSYDVATTTYDVEDFHKARPPKRTAHHIVTCKVTMVMALPHGAASRVACDGEIDPTVTIAGDWGATADGLFRITGFPKTEADIANGTPILPAKPHPFRHSDHDAVHGLRSTAHAWCIFDDTSHDDGGFTRSQCFEANVGIVSGELEGGGDDWRRVSYRLKARP